MENNRTNRDSGMDKGGPIYFENKYSNNKCDGLLLEKKLYRDNA